MADSAQSTADRLGAILLYHGSSSPGAVVAERALADRVAACGGAIAGAEVSHLSGGDEEMALAVRALVAKGVSAVVVVPMFLAPGGHVQRDIPALIARAREKFPGVAIVESQIIGAANRLADAVFNLIALTPIPPRPS